MLAINNQYFLHLQTESKDRNAFIHHKNSTINCKLENIYINLFGCVSFL